MKSLILAALLIPLAQPSLATIAAIATSSLIVGFAIGRRTKRHGVSAPTFFRQESGTDSPMYQMFSKLLGMTVLLLLSAGAASADSIWQYQGNTMAGCSCSLDGSVTLDSLGNATSWDFTDGTHELTNLNSTASFNAYIPPLFGTWTVSITGAGVAFWTQFYGSYYEATDSSAVNGSLFGYLEGNVGTWTDPPVSTPEPGSLFLLAAGLVAALVLARQRLAGITAIASGERA